MKIPNTRRALAAGFALGLIPGAAMAHPGHQALGLVSGFAHPFEGADHMLAMIAVGLWAALRRDRATVVWPAAFVAAMAPGYALGQLDPSAFSIEPTVLASVIILGVLTAAQARLRLAVGAALIGAFGAAHGYAHGVEAPGAGAAYPLGFGLATGVLHVVGLAAGLLLRRLGRPELVRLLGAGAAAGGLLLAVA